MIFVIVYKKIDEWYIEWQRVVQQVIMRGTTSDNERCKKVVLGFKRKQKGNLFPEDFYLFSYARVSKKKYVKTVSNPSKTHKHQEMRCWEAAEPFNTSAEPKWISLKLLVQNYWKIALLEWKWPTYWTYKLTVVC